MKQPTLDPQRVAAPALAVFSIALALRASADIFVEERLLDAATLEFSQDLDFSPAKDAAETTFGEATFDVQITSAEDLEERLRRLNPEDFGRFKP